MSKPMTVTQLKRQLDKWNVPYREYRDWETHNRGSRGNGWTNLKGFMVHHTGSDSRDQRALLYNGFSNLPGPLCQFGLAQDGTVWLIGWGRANHAGSGDRDVLNAVISEDYGKAPPTDNQTNTDGNGYFYGVEIWYSGSHGMSPSQYGSLLKLASAVLDFHGWNKKSVIAHGEWQPGKWDPGYASGRMMDMHAVREDIGDVLSGNPRDDKGEEKPVSGQDEKPKVYKDVFEGDYVPAPKAWPSADTNRYWWPISFLRETLDIVIEIRDIVKEIKDRGN